MRSISGKEYLSLFEPFHFDMVFPKQTFRNIVLSRNSDWMKADGLNVAKFINGLGCYLK
jgi:hypothetical protein